MNKWKVYLSSTFKDLHELRTTLINLFQNELKKSFELCHIMERMYNDGTYIPFVEDCISAVESCDIYFIILGNEIGSFPPTDILKTYTEIELDTAIKLKKKIFCLRLESFDLKNENINKHKEILEKFKGFPTHKFINEIELENILFRCLIQFTSEKPINQNNPYKGLNAFKISDGEYFFGRSEEIENCIRKIVSSKSNSNVSIIGSSGIGKTSFVQAGIIFKLLQRHDFKDFKTIILTPGNKPFTNLQYEAEFINENDLNVFHNTILYLNQFEEVYTQCNSQESIDERNKLFNILDKLSSSETIKCHIISSFRSDFISQLGDSDFIKNSFLITLSSLNYSFNISKWYASFKEIITCPALNNGVEIEEVLVARLLEEIKEIDGPLPILQFTLEKLWSKETTADRIITASEYEKISEGKGISGIIENHANKIVGEIIQGDIDRERIIKSIFVNLVEVNSSQYDVRKTLKKSTLFTLLKVYPKDIVNDIFEQLVGDKSRLLIVSKTKDDSINVDIVHEVIIRKWQKLRIWIDERRESLEFRQKLMFDIKSFEAGFENLMDKQKIKRVDFWKENNLDLLNSEIIDFIKKSKNGLNKKNDLIVKNSIVLLSISILIFFLFKITKYKLRWNEINSTFKTEKFNDFRLNMHNDEREKNIVDLVNELEYTPEIAKELSLGDIKFFTNLKSFSINGNDELHDLSDIKSNINLKELKITNCKNLRNLKGIEKLKNLVSLTLDDNLKLEEINGIQYLSKLNFLDLRGSTKSVKDIFLFQECNSISNIVIGNNNDGDLFRSITRMKNLSELSLISIDSISNFIKSGNFKRLKKLKISNSVLSNLSGFCSSFNLDMLELDYNYLVDFKNIGVPIQIDKLIIKSNRDLKSLYGLRNFTRLKNISISQNDSLTDIAELNLLKELNTVDIGFNNILKKFDIGKNFAIQNVNIVWPTNNILKEISHLKNLQKLSIYGNKNIIDLDILKNLNIKTLELSNCENVRNFQFGRLNIIDSLIFIDLKNINLLLGFEKVNSLFINNTEESLRLPRFDRLKNLKFLKIGVGSKLKSLKGIEILKSLKHLEISDNTRKSNLNIDSISELDSLKYLSTYKINLDSNFLKNLDTLIFTGDEEDFKIEKILKFKNLKTLALYSFRNQKVDLTSMKLKSLKLSSCNFAKFKLPNSLMDLDLGYCDSVFNLEFTNNLKNISKIKLTDNRTFNRIGNIIKNNKLKSLSISLCEEINSIEEISKFNELKELEIVGNEYLSLESFIKLKKLNSLEKFIFSASYGWYSYQNVPDILLSPKMRLISISSEIGFDENKVREYNSKIKIVRP